MARNAATAACCSAAVLLLVVSVYAASDTKGPRTAVPPASREQAPCYLCTATLRGSWRRRTSRLGLGAPRPATWQVWPPLASKARGMDPTRESQRSWTTARNTPIQTLMTIQVPIQTLILIQTPILMTRRTTARRQEARSIRLPGARSFGRSAR
jgi:hypothetical protein